MKKPAGWATWGGVMTTSVISVDGALNEAGCGPQARRWSALIRMGSRIERGSVKWPKGQLPKAYRTRYGPVDQPRSAKSRATVLEVMAPPRSAYRVSRSGVTSCLRQVSAISCSAKAAASPSATSQPTM